MPVLPDEAPKPGEDRARTKYQPRRERHGTALCLSGGGYRAALFHLGALRRLDELGVLGQIDTFASVSGGSIVAAFLADWIASAQAEGDHTWPMGHRILSDSPDQPVALAERIRDFTAQNIRTMWVLQLLWPGSWPASTVAVRSLENAYRERITSLRLDQLPSSPRFIFCATDLAFACGWFSESTGVGDYQAGFAEPQPSWPVARAVAASSCFPPVFNPLPIDLEPGQLIDGRARLRRDRAELIAGLRLSDGGVYDNLGLEPVWKDHERVLVSDAGGTLDFEPDRGLFRRLRRYLAVTEAQGTEVRKRWLISSFLEKTMSGAYWGISSSPHAYRVRPRGYSRDLAQTVIAAVRTDLDAFSLPEQCVLENHGYLMADAAIRTHAADLLPPGRPSPVSPPHPEWMNEGKVRVALANSGERELFGRWRRTVSLAVGESQPEPQATELLQRYRPCLQYDSDERYFADSPATMTNLVVPGGASGPPHANELKRADGTVIAIAGGGGHPALDLDFLGATYPDGSEALETDYIDETGGDPRDDAALMHEDKELADVCFGHARLDGQRRLWLQYWLFFYYDEFRILGPLEGGLHEGDWEMIQLRIGRRDRVEEATYAQHNYAQRATWDELEHVESEDGAVPLVYCAWGSHASYMRAGNHHATLGVDHNDGQGPRVRPRLAAQTLSDAGPGWALWPGIWGSTRKRAWWDSDSPRGPRQHAQWFDPALFAARARPAPSSPPGELVGADIPVPAAA